MGYTWRANDVQASDVVLSQLTIDDRIIDVTTSFNRRGVDQKQQEADDTQCSQSCHFTNEVWSRRDNESVEAVMNHRQLPHLPHTSTYDVDGLNHSTQGAQHAASVKRSGCWMINYDILYY